MSKTKKATESEIPSLQEQMDQLATIVEQMESPDVSLEASLQLYEQGMQLVGTATKTPEAAEQRVNQVGPDGEVQALDT